MNRKKAEVTQVFIFTFSIIIIVFAGFLVVKFIGTFLGAADEREDNLFYNQFDQDFYSVYTTPGSKKLYDYKVSSNINLICFLGGNQSASSLDLSSVANEDSSVFESLYDSGERIVSFDKDTILNSHKPDKNFVISADNSFCIQPSTGKFSLIFENVRNIVYISQMQT